eukprot:403372711
MGEEVLFSTGTDEHGLKIQKKANEAGIDALKFCDKNSEQFRKLFEQASISYDRFIRTTDSKYQQSIYNLIDDHKVAVLDFWNRLVDRGYIIEGKHEGYYSVNEESFISEKDLARDEKGNYFTLLDESVELIQERNFVFDIDLRLRIQIKQWLNSGAVEPEHIKEKLLDDMNMRKSEISVSRPTSRIAWGIKVPNDSSQTIYVWLDALVNYLTVIGYPNQMRQNGAEIGELIHVIGKDIAKFHCIYWPAFLRADDLPFPKRVICHGHWLQNKMKMSKSLGNVVDPFDLIKTFGINSVRSYFLSQGPQFKDSDFQMDQLTIHHNGVVCDQYMNLLQRITGKKIWKNRTVLEPMNEKQIEMIGLETKDQINLLAEDCLNLMKSYEFTLAFKKIEEILYIGNFILANNKFWAIKDEKELDALLYTTMEILKVTSILLQPYCPDLSKNMLDFLQIKERFLDQATFVFDRRITFDNKAREKLFIPKIEQKQADTKQ